MPKPRGRDETKPQRRPDSGKKATVRSSKIKGQPKYRHYGRAPLKRGKDGLPKLAKEIPKKILPREMLEPLTDNHIRFLVAFWRLGKEKMALAAIGFSVSGFNKWKAQEDFRACYDLMKGIVDDHWEDALERSWDEGYEEHEDVWDIVRDGEGDPKFDAEGKNVLRRRRVKTRVKRDTSVIRDINRARQPEKYGRPGQGGGGVTINVVFESVDVKAKLEATEVKELMPVETLEEGEENGG